MSPRNFARACAAEVGVTPARAIERLRVEVARDSVENSVEPTRPGDWIDSRQCIRQITIQRCMAMNWRSAALAMAGVIGSGVAVVHGILVQRLMVRPFEALALADGRIGVSIRRLVPLLLHFSTISWFLGGLALIAAARWLEPDARLATGICVGSLYLFGALANLWGTRGLHPGWMLMTVALVLIAFGVSKPIY